VILNAMSLKESECDLELPSYDDAVSEQRPSSTHSQPTIQDEVNLELWRLATGFQHTQGQRVIQTQAQDQKALELLVPEIRDFLDDFSKTTLRQATLIIIPAGKIDEDATLCDSDLLNGDEYHRVVKTEGGKGAIDFSTWNETAKRLASYLQPRAENASMKRPSPQAEPARATPTTRFWSKKSPGVESVAAARPDDVVDPLSTVGMDVKAEEVAFRIQTLLGLYETQSICGLVIRIRVNAKGLKGQTPSCTSGFYL
jgi:hypothetical protein